MSTVDLTAEFARLTDEAVKLREERNTLRGEIKELKAQHQERIERLIEANQNLRAGMRKLMAAQEEHVKPAQLMLPDEVIASLGAVADALVMTERWFQIQNEPGFSVARAATSTALEHALTAHRLLKRAYSR